MTKLSPHMTRRVRVLGALAFVLAITVALAVRVGLNDGGWPLFVPSLAAAGVIVWPIRAMVLAAIAATAAILLLGLMTVGIFYGCSLAALIFALAAFKPGADQATAYGGVVADGVPSNSVE
jgi:ABC-type anion transport system duplicated permease subunit